SLVYFVAYKFFFSSRRRHTRSKRDWSSDVCSSDLETDGRADAFAPLVFFADFRSPPGPREAPSFVHGAGDRRGGRAVRDARLPEIGRASCRERVESLEGEVGVE